MKNAICALMLLGGFGLTTSYAVAQEAGAAKTTTKTTAKKPAAKSTPKKTGKKAAAAGAAGAAGAATAASVDEDDIKPDITGSTVVDYQCELGNKVTVYENETDSQHVAVRWGKELHRLKRVSTTTGASRFENKKYGLVWIGIPAKGMLLDSKKGKQLANECRNSDQLAKHKAAESAVSASSASGTQAVTAGSGTAVSTGTAP